MTYTAPEVLTFIAALGVLITGVGAVIVNIIVALRTGAKVDAALVATSGLVHQVQEVHTLTNSNLSAVKAELAAARTQITSLHDVVQDLKSERAATARAAAAASLSPVAANAAGDTLAQIETNTLNTVAALKDQAKT